MRWNVIDKTAAVIPTKGGYREWKPQLADESRQQCVYCCIHESRFGGLRNFHVEHFKPQSLFPLLANDYSNLFYACGVCNIFKSDDWPGDHQVADYTLPVYPNPTQVNYNDFLTIDDSTGLVASTTVTGRYIISRLHLNRPHIVGLRSITALFARINEVHNAISELLSTGAIPDNKKDEVIGTLLALHKLTLQYANVRPYGADQLKKAA